MRQVFLESYAGLAGTGWRKSENRGLRIVTLHPANPNSCLSPCLTKLDQRYLFNPRNSLSRIDAVKVKDS